MFTREFLLFQTILATLTSSALPEATPPASSPPSGAVPPASSSPPAAEARADEQPAGPANTGEDAEEPPEGYYAFVESPNATPPRYIVLYNSLLSF